MVKKRIFIKKKKFFKRQKAPVDPMVKRDARMANVDWGRLEPRERKVAEFLGEGLSVEEIGIRLGIATRTAQEYCYSINRKLGLKGMEELTIAIQEWQEKW
jgi:DNA-binding CsgD family transcriptional regulator